MSFREALNIYIDNPEKYPDLVLFYNDDVTIIKDMYPKALRHYLVIPRAADVTKVPPHAVFLDNPNLYNLLDKYVEKAKQMIVEDMVKECLLEENDSLKSNEFANFFIKAGIHSTPSLSNLHVHVITQDFYSSRLKNKKHYNSFTTAFFIDFSKLEPKDEERLENSNSESTSDGEQNTKINLRYLSALIKISPLRCSTCGRSFDNRFVKLKDHLEIEFCKKFNISREKARNLLPNGTR